MSIRIGTMAGATKSEFPFHVPCMNGRASFTDPLTGELMKALEPYAGNAERNSEAEFPDCENPVSVSSSTSSSFWLDQEQMQMPQTRFPNSNPLENATSLSLDESSASGPSISDSWLELFLKGSINDVDLAFCPSFQGLSGNNQQQHVFPSDNGRNIDVGLLQSLPISQMGSSQLASSQMGSSQLGLS